MNTQEHFQKSMSVNTVRWAILKCWLKLFYEHDPETQPFLLGQSSFKKDWGKD